MILLDAAEMARCTGKGTLDFCITADSSPHPGSTPYGAQYYPDLEIRLIQEYLDILIVGKKFSFLADKEITLRELCDYPLIGWAPGTVSREFFEDLFRQCGLRLKASIELETLNTDFADRKGVRLKLCSVSLRGGKNPPRIPYSLCGCGIAPSRESLSCEPAAPVRSALRPTVP
jgi:hypothetical protein